MGFSPEIKRALLVKSARHCCVCKRFKGINIEVHHIIPKEQGGEDSLDNGIPLCFDCHADAGHYNSKHPRGTKFSSTELKLHKENWFRIVEENSIPLKKENLVHTRYLITKEFGLIKSISNIELDKFPIKNCFLLDNQTLKKFREISSGQEYRHLEIENALKINHEEYSEKFPTASLIKEESGYQHFYHERIPSADDIRIHCQIDRISQYLLENGCKPKKIVKILTYYENGCGSGGFHEVFILRPLYFRYLVLTNISHEHINFKTLISRTNDELVYSMGNFSKKENMDFPKVLIEPGQSVIVPIGMFLADFDDLRKSKDYIRIHEIDGDRSQVFDHTSIINYENLEYFGENYFPELLTFTINEDLQTQEIHDFDFGNTFLIDGYWNCGSCPHLFFEKNNSELIYHGEILNALPEIKSKYFFKIKSHIKQLIIAELENEITTICFLKVNGTTKYKNTKLMRGQILKTSVCENDVIEIEGYYSIKSNSNKTLPIYEKYNVVNNFQSEYLDNVCRV